MKRLFLLPFALLAAACGQPSNSQPPRPSNSQNINGQTALTQPADKSLFLSFRARADQDPTADPDSAFWKNVPGVVMDTSVMGDPMPEFRAEIRSRWTDKNIYFLFIGHTQQFTLNASPNTEKETQRLWNHDVFELYIGADYEHTNRYRELQISPQGEFLDNDIDSTRQRPGFNGEDAWNSGFHVKAHMDNTVKIWTGEMQIPFTALQDARQPAAGETLRVNLFRQDTPMAPIPPMPHDPQTRPRDFLAWQPPGVWNPHHPEKFGTLRLVASQ